MHNPNPIPNPNPNQIPNPNPVINPPFPFISILRNGYEFWGSTGLGKKCAAGRWCRIQDSGVVHFIPLKCTRSLRNDE